MAQIVGSGKAEKTRFWEVCCYPENMRSDWRVALPDLIEIPGSYCLHDKDLLKDDKFFDDPSQPRKPHIHLILCYPGPTTLNHAINTANLLSLPGKRCCSTAKQVIFMRKAWNYLIHDTDTCRAQHKFLYDPSDRIDFNNFDIGAFEQITTDERSERRRLITAWAIDCNFVNYADLYQAISLGQYSDNPILDEDVLIGYSAHFERICRAVYLRCKGDLGKI